MPSGMALCGLLTDIDEDAARTRPAFHCAMVGVEVPVVVAAGVLDGVVGDVVGGSIDCAASASSKTDLVAGGGVVCATATPAIISSAAPAASNMRFMVFSSTLNAAMDEASCHSNRRVAQAVAGSEYTHPRRARSKP